MNIYLHTRRLDRTHDPLRFLLIVAYRLTIVVHRLTRTIVLSDWLGSDLFEVLLHLVIIDLFLTWLPLVCQAFITLPHLLNHVVDLCAVTVLGTLHVCAMFCALIKRTGLWLWFVDDICLNESVN